MTSTPAVSKFTPSSSKKKTKTKARSTVSTKHTKAQQITGLFGKTVTNVASWFVVGFLYYLIALYIGSRLIPSFMSLLAQLIGINLEQANMNGYLVWGMASLALTLFLVALGLVLMRAIWRLRTKVVTKINNWFGQRDTQLSK